MPQLSPSAEGFRTAFRRPLFTLAEIMWRWVVGATAITLFFFGFFEFLNTLPVTGGDLLFLKSRQPFLISQAIAHILRGTLYRGVTSLMLAAVLIGVLWMVAASLGRIATMRAVFEHVREQISRKAMALGIVIGETKAFSDRNPLRPLLRLNFLRLSVVLASVIAFWGASVVAGFAATSKDPRPGLVFLLFIPLAGLIILIWFCLNWLLSLSTVFAVRNGEDALESISSAVSLCRERPGAVIAVSTWTGLAHLVAFVAATTVVGIPLSLTPLLAWRLVALALILVTLVYFAVADWVHMARMTGYAVILEMPEALWVAPQPIPSQPTPSLSTGIDKDELILSDLPNLATQT